MTTLFRRTIFLYMLLLEFRVVSARVLANFWVRHWLFVAILHIPDAYLHSAVASRLSVITILLATGFGEPDLACPHTSSALKHARR
jgi:hypothetical protein